MRISWKKSLSVGAIHQEMALPSRYGSAMLSRGMAIPSPISIAAQASRRAFSTLPALQLHASTRFHSDDPKKVSKFDATSRQNPLIGDIPIPPKPAPKPTAIDDFIPPPPPPRPQPTTTSTSATNSAQEDKDLPSKPPSGFKYNAADPSSDPFRSLDIDLLDILVTKATSYGRNLGMSDPLARPKVRTKAVTGRTVFIADRLTPTTAPTPVVAIRVLERMCREQKVKNKFHSQKFHERKGLKRKRLRSERWRARFKVGFKAAVSKVIELKKQGW